VKFNAAEKSPTGTFATMWQVGDPEKSPWQTPSPLRLAPDTFHEIQIPANLFDENGVLTISIGQPQPGHAHFSHGGRHEVLYREGGFGLNFIRGLGVILCWMTLFATLGLTAASFLIVPVAAFASLSALIDQLVVHGPPLTSVVEQGTVMGSNEETGVVGSSAIDAVAVPLFRGILNLIKPGQRIFSPIDSLSTGRSIRCRRWARRLRKSSSCWAACWAYSASGRSPGANWRPHREPNESSNHQHPSSNEASASSFMTVSAPAVLALGVWNFSGAWMLELGACPKTHEPTRQKGIAQPRHSRAGRGGGLTQRSMNRDRDRSV